MVRVMAKALAQVAAARIRIMRSHVSRLQGKGQPGTKIYPLSMCKCPKCLAAWHRQCDMYAAMLLYLSAWKMETLSAWNIEAHSLLYFEPFKMRNNQYSTLGPSLMCTHVLDLSYTFHTRRAPSRQ